MIYERNFQCEQCLGRFVCRGTIGGYRKADGAGRQAKCSAGTAQ